jgi:hypothetical protein
MKEETAVQAEQIETIDISDQDLDDIKRLSRLKRDRDSLDQEIEFLTEWAAKSIGKSYAYEDGDTIVTVSVVRGASTSVDLEVLRGINPDLAEQITKQVVDNTRLKEAQNLGFFAGGRAEASSVITAPKKPYVKFTAKPKKETDSND